MAAELAPMCNIGNCGATAIVRKPLSTNGSPAVVKAPNKTPAPPGGGFAFLTLGAPGRATGV